MARDHVISLRLNDRQFNILKEQADRFGITVSEHVRRELFPDTEKPAMYFSEPVTTHAHTYSTTDSGHFVYWNMP
jgi:hypothetical protein